MTHPNSPDALPLICDGCHSQRCHCRPCANQFCTEWLTPHERSGLCLDCAWAASLELQRQYGVAPEEATPEGLLIAGGYAYQPEWQPGGDVVVHERGEVLL